MTAPDTRRERLMNRRLHDIIPAVSPTSQASQS
jgi:hypothetical protein